MRKLLFCSAALLALPVALFISSQASHAQGGKMANPQLEYPLPKGAEAYGSIDGHHLWSYVEEQTKIARDYRDNGHPQYWGRISGTSGDEVDVKWLLDKYKQAGLTDTKAQPVNYFLPQWNGKSWSVELTGGGKTMKLESAQPPYGSPDTAGKELDLEAVYVGLGTEADYVGKDVKGKAVVLLKLSYNFPYDAVKRAMAHGAGAIFGVDQHGNNYKAQAYRAYSNVPTFSLGTADGYAVRDMFGAGAAPHLKMRMEAEWVKGQHGYLVWGTLPGATDETIYVIAHRDGWFEAAGDNASGVATMLGLAEYYGKIPQAQRKRTMIFLGNDGHHQIMPGFYGMSWVNANREKFFSKTALLINAEHPAEVLTHGGYAGTTTATIPNQWYAGGGDKPNLEKIAINAFHEFGVPVWDQPSKYPPGGDMGPVGWYVPGIVVQSNDFVNMHTDHDNADTVSWAGLQAITRAYARMIDEVNKLPLSELKVPTRPNSGQWDVGLDLANCQAWIKDSSANCTPAGDNPGPAMIPPTPPAE